MNWNFSAWSIRNPVPPILLFICLIALENAFQFSQLHFIVYAGGQMAGAHLHRMHFDAVCIGQCNQVGKVIFALRIVALQGIQPTFQLGIGQH